MKSRKRSEYKLDPKTGVVLSENQTKKDKLGMYPSNKLVEDYELEYVIGDGYKYPIEHENFVKINSYQDGSEIKLHTYRYPAYAVVKQPQNEKHNENHTELNQKNQNKGKIKGVIYLL